MKLGIRLESLGLPFRPALTAASKLGVSGLQLDAVGDLAPAQLSETGRKELRHLLRSHALELTALYCPLRHSLDHPVSLQSRIDRLKNALKLSVDLGARKIIIDAGRMPTAADDPRAGTMREALIALGTHADRIGAVLALDTGLDSGETLGTYLGTFDIGALGVNYDPANMLMHGFDPVTNLAPLKQWIVHTHAHDIRQSSGGADDVPIGHGEIEWMSYLGTLAAQDYASWIVVETSEPNAAMVEQGVRFLGRLV
ncbi:MAG: sugar phosphate isomerase/epimerase family protein [Gemmataceae bacterium]